MAIPIEIHAAIVDQAIHFNLLHAKNGSRLRNQQYCPVCKITLERGDLMRGHQYAKNKYVQFTDAELEALQDQANSSIDLQEFIPASAVDPIYFESAYYLAPDAGGEKPYQRPAPDSLSQRPIQKPIHESSVSYYNLA